MTGYKILTTVLRTTTAFLLIGYDEQDQGRIAYSLDRNQRSSWTNSTTGRRTTVMPSPTITSSSTSEQCREFTVDTEIGNRTESAYGTACRQGDGGWKITGS